MVPAPVNIAYTPGMAELGDLLELLYGAHRRFRTARGSVDYRCDILMMRRAVDREVERIRSIPNGSVAVAFGDTLSDDSPQLHREEIRFWWGPEQLREQTFKGRLIVRDGESWWRYTPDRGLISDADRPDAFPGGGERYQHLLDPSGFLSTLEFGDLEREAGLLRVQAWPRAECVSGLRADYAGADEIRLLVDTQIGVVRRADSYLDGQALSSTEITEIAFDEEFPEDTFAPLSLS